MILSRKKHAVALFLAWTLGIASSNRGLSKENRAGFFSGIPTASEQFSFIVWELLIEIQIMY